MAVTVYIPTPFRRATGEPRSRRGQRARRAARCSTSWSARYGGLKGLVRNDAGEVHRHVNDLRQQRADRRPGGLAAPLKDGDEVAIIPALAGGRTLR